MIDLVVGEVTATSPLTVAIDDGAGATTIPGGAWGAAVGDRVLVAVNARTRVRLYALGQVPGATPWAAVTFQNSWANFDGGFQSVQYRRVGDMVQLRGLANPGTITLGTVAFTLPAGFRPPAGVMFGVMNNSPDGIARIDIANNGNVSYIAGGNGTYLSFDGVSFSVAS